MITLNLAAFCLLTHGYNTSNSVRGRPFPSGHDDDDYGDRPMVRYLLPGELNLCIDFKSSLESVTWLGNRTPRDSLVVAPGAATEIPRAQKSLQMACSEYSEQLALIVLPLAPPGDAGGENRKYG